MVYIPTTTPDVTNTSTEATHVGAHTPKIPPSNHSQYSYMITQVVTISPCTGTTTHELRLPTLIFASVTSIILKPALNGIMWKFLANQRVHCAINTSVTNHWHEEEEEEQIQPQPDCYPFLLNEVIHLQHILLIILETINRFIPVIHLPCNDRIIIVCHTGSDLSSHGSKWSSVGLNNVLN